ncbi:hypothetical protein KC19_1G062400 [Ceratodon purpureus]|uniref:Uncharacterized protein n=1 Tax=Ceratodon purpureus TaxID=3225 RepID=A0A8T0J380_CERPU|nr:hypothetical protein KC19_1G062400 [Ceratodon purpureus]
MSTKRLFKKLLNGPKKIKNKNREYRMQRLLLIRRIVETYKVLG